MLGIDYSSSDDEEEDPKHLKSTVNTSEDSNEEKVVNKSNAESIVNPFDANNYELSSSEDDSQEFEPKMKKSDEKSVVINNELNERRIESNVKNPIQSKVSIFSNPFKDEETKELSQLERHVRLSDNKTQSGDSEDYNKSKTICWSYNKHKRCRFGNRCRFRHNDSDFIDIKGIKRNDNSGKKRVGITDSLVPPKRAMTAYISQQNI